MATDSLGGPDSPVEVIHAKCLARLESELRSQQSGRDFDWPVTVSTL